MIPGALFIWDYPRTFQTVARLLSFNRAAEILNYSQSIVSAQIKLLEEEFGVTLFNRLGKRISLTEAGQMLMGYSQKMLDIEQEGTGSVKWETTYAAKGSMKSCSQESPLSRIPRATAGTFFVVK